MITMLKGAEVYTPEAIGIETFGSLVHRSSRWMGLYQTA